MLESGRRVEQAGDLAWHQRAIANGYSSLALPQVPERTKRKGLSSTVEQLGASLALQALAFSYTERACAISRMDTGLP